MPVITQQFQVALSFPGEHRALVEQIAAELARALKQELVFYDKYYEAELAVPNLDTLLQKIYAEQSRLVVIFLCAVYDVKKWCGLEWRAIRTLIADRQDTRLMFFRVDAGKVPGFFDGIDGYIATEGRSAPELAALILKRVGREQATPVEQDTDVATKGLAALGDLMASPDVKRAVEDYEGRISETGKRIDTLSQYKSVHDQLHSLQVHCYTPIWNEFRRFPERPIDWDKLEEYANNLENVSDALGDATAQECFTQVEKDRLKLTVRTLGAARAQLTAAIQNPDPKQLEMICQRLRQILNTQPDYFSINLSGLAKNLNLEKLADTMTQLHDQLGHYKVDELKFRQFEEGIAALGRLGVELNKGIDNHDRWQEFDSDLRRFDELPAQQFKQELEWSWQDLKDKSQRLNSGSAESWEALIRDKTVELDEAVRTQPPDKVAYAFQKYRGWAVQRFYRVDRDLLKNCDKLVKVGQPLDAILEKNR